jgi:hypothetical protein
MIIILKERMLRIQVMNDEPEQQNEVRKQKEKEDVVDRDGCLGEDESFEVEVANRQ